MLYSARVGCFESQPSVETTHTLFSMFIIFPSSVRYSTDGWRKMVECGGLETGFQIKSVPTSHTERITQFISFDPIKRWLLTHRYISLSVEEQRRWKVHEFKHQKRMVQNRETIKSHHYLVYLERMWPLLVEKGASSSFSFKQDKVIIILIIDRSLRSGVPLPLNHDPKGFLWTNYRW